jgi:hypothetical protein
MNSKVHFPNIFFYNINIFFNNNNFKTKILEINNLSQIYQTKSEHQEEVIQKYLRLPIKKENEIQRKAIKEEVFMAKKSFHEVNISLQTIHFFI